MPVPVRLLLSGTQSQASTDTNSVTIDVSGWETKLQASPNLSVQYNCVHSFGGVRCGVDPVSSVGVCVSAYGAIPTRLDLASAPPLAASRYQLGTARVLSGPFAGMSWEINDVVGDNVYIQGSPPSYLSDSAVLVSTGCKKSFAACQENGNDRYLGFPRVPGAARAYLASRSI